MMRKILVTSIVLFLSFPLFSVPTATAADCSNVKQVLWDGVAMSPGQTGRVTVVKDTGLYKVANGKMVYQRALSKGQVLKVYASTTNYLGVGGGYYVLRNANVKYETASKTKLEQLACVSSREVTLFSIGLGDPRSKVEAIYGKPKRLTKNEYGLIWETYYQKQYEKFLMVAYTNGKVAMMYTNQAGVYSKKGISLASTKSTILQKYGTSISFIEKNNTRYILPDENEYGVYLLDGSYITFFYDNLLKNQLSAVLVIRSDLEENKTGFYGTTSAVVEEGYARQMFDVVNATRVKFRLKPLTWRPEVATTADQHSSDMAIHDFFEHVNLQGQKVGDRLERNRIPFTVAGENIAMGQFDAIYAHESLMNSKGHRSNVLLGEFTQLGVGVSFNGKSVPYYTQNFLTP